MPIGSGGVLGIVGDGAEGPFNGDTESMESNFDLVLEICALFFNLYLLLFSLCSEVFLRENVTMMKSDIETSQNPTTATTGAQIFIKSDVCI